MARSQRGASHVGQLFRMQLDRQAQRARRVEDALGLRRRERDALAERIDRVDESFLRQRGQHVVADAVDIGVAASRVLGRQRVRAEKRRAHDDAVRLGEPARDLAAACAQSQGRVRSPT